MNKLMISLESMPNNSFQVNLILEEVYFIQLILMLIGEPEKQGTLIRQLQDQHYIQYIQQLEAAHRGDMNESNNTTELYKEEVRIICE